MSVNLHVCPACGQPLPERPRGRICSVCQRTIRRHDKWLFVGSSVQHRDCNNPEMYPSDKPPAAQHSLLEP